MATLSVRTQAKQKTQKTKKTLNKKHYTQKTSLIRHLGVKNHHSKTILLRVYHRFSTNSSHAARCFLLVIVMVDLCHCRILPDIVGRCRILVLGRFIAQHISALSSSSSIGIFQAWMWSYPSFARRENRAEDMRRNLKEP